MLFVIVVLRWFCTYTRKCVYAFFVFSLDLCFFFLRSSIIVSYSLRFDCFSSRNIFLSFVFVRVHVHDILVLLIHAVAPATAVFVRCFLLLSLIVFDFKTNLRFVLLLFNKIFLLLLLFYSYIWPLCANTANQMQTLNENKQRSRKSQELRQRRVHERERALTKTTSIYALIWLFLLLLGPKEKNMQAKTALLMNCVHGWGLRCKQRNNTKHTLTLKSQRKRWRKACMISLPWFRSEAVIIHINDFFYSLFIIIFCFGVFAVFSGHFSSCCFVFLGLTKKNKISLFV